MNDPKALLPLTPDEEKQLTDKEYWTRIDTYSANLIVSAKEQVGGTSLTWMDSFLSAASALAVAQKIPLDQLMARLIGTYIELGGTVPKGLTQQQSQDQSFANLKPGPGDLLN